MQIQQHNHRITSVAVSMYGHVIASGDEEGNVKLLMLRLLDSLSISRRKRLEKEKEEDTGKRSSIDTFVQLNYVTPFLPSYQVGDTLLWSSAI
jgi:hypothetical protein